MFTFWHLAQLVTGQAAMSFGPENDACPGQSKPFYHTQRWSRLDSKRLFGKILFPKNLIGQCWIKTKLRQTRASVIFWTLGTWWVRISQLHKKTSSRPTFWVFSNNFTTLDVSCTRLVECWALQCPELTNSNPPRPTGIRGIRGTIFWSVLVVKGASRQKTGESANKKISHSYVFAENRIIA